MNHIARRKINTFTIERDPHHDFTPGEVISRAYVLELLRGMYSDGLELSARGKLYRIYQGIIYVLKNTKYGLSMSQTDLFNKGYPPR